MLTLQPSGQKHSLPTQRANDLECLDTERARRTRNGAAYRYTLNHKIKKSKLLLDNHTSLCFNRGLLGYTVDFGPYTWDFHHWDSYYGQGQGTWMGSSLWSGRQTRTTPVSTAIRPSCFRYPGPEVKLQPQILNPNPEPPKRPAFPLKEPVKKKTKQNQIPKVL